MTEIKEIFDRFVDKILAYTPDKTKKKLKKKPAKKDR